MANEKRTIWQNIVKKSKKILAPMVDQSELAWRLLSRRHGADLCYSPMLHASIFLRDARYRKENLVTCPQDRPLVVQFCANDPDILLEAVRLVADDCDAVDLNLGCPQAIAKRGHYGAYLQEDWDLVHKMINTVHTQLDIPICCKIRVFNDVNKTIEYAKMLEAAGCQLLAVHGRVREQKGRLTGVADWDQIRAIKENVKISVFANGNVQYGADVDRCLNYTSVDGIMIAEGSLYNPTLFENRNLPVWETALEYLEIATEYPCPMSFIRGHLFKLFHHCLQLSENRDLQEELAQAGNMHDFRSVTCKLRDRFPRTENHHQNQSLPFQLPLPVFICQPYVRPSDSDTKMKETTGQKRQMDVDTTLSRRKLKKLLKHPNRCVDKKTKEEYKICQSCCNPKGAKCSFNMCKACCKVFSFTHLSDCPSS
uniref:tRNA-dihydrouridine(16/17) synthase [NAD(P)(+)] n=1 Tax=Strigamia maritima TaxID=126957 RepID=T1J1T2_STRMM